MVEGLVYSCFCWGGGPSKGSCRAPFKGLGALIQGRFRVGPYESYMVVCRNEKSVSLYTRHKGLWAALEYGSY